MSCWKKWNWGLLVNCVKRLLIFFLNVGVFFGDLYVYEGSKLLLKGYINFVRGFCICLL